MSRLIVVIALTTLAVGAGAEIVEHPRLKAPSLSEWSSISPNSSRPSYPGSSSSYSSPSYSSYSSSYSPRTTYTPSTYQFPSQPADPVKYARGFRGLVLIVAFVIGLFFKMIRGACRLFRR